MGSSSQTLTPIVPKSGTDSPGDGLIQKPLKNVQLGNTRAEKPNKLKVQAILKSTDNRAKKVDPTKNVGRKKYYPVIFSRKETYTRPDKADKGPQDNENDSSHELASIVHQTDRHGNQTPKHFKQPAQDSEAVRLTKCQDQEACKALQQVSKRPRSFIGFIQRMCCCIAGPVVQNLAAQSQENMMRIDEEEPESQNAPGLLGPIHSDDAGKKCLVLDLDETLVHSSFKPIPAPDYVIPVEIEGTVHKVYVRKRPKVDEFLRDLAQYFEIVVYTASLSKYADPLLDMMDHDKVIRYRLFREHCVFHEGSYVKDLSQLGRNINEVIFIDNSPMSYIFQPQNAIGCTSFIDDPKDVELDVIKDFLRTIVPVEDVRDHLHLWDSNYKPYL